MNYYEQFYDDLEFYEEDEGPRHASQQEHGYEESSWTHRDEMYRSPDRERERHHDREHDRDPYRGHERDSYRSHESDPNRSHERDPYRSHESDPYRGHESDPYRGHESDSYKLYEGYEDSSVPDGGYRDDWGNDRWRGRFNRGRGPRNRGRGFGDRGRGRWPERRGRGWPRGNVRGVPKMNFVKASEPTELAPQTTEAKTDLEPVTKGVGSETTTMPALPVLSSYGYGPGSDFQEFGGGSTETPQRHNFDPGVPGEEAPGTQTPVSSQPAPGVAEASKPAPNKVVTAVVKPMYNFVKAKSEFKSTDVAFHEAPSVNKIGNPNPLDPTQARAGIGMPVGQKMSLQTFDVATAFYAKAKDGINPVFDARFERLRQAIKACSLPSKNAIEIIHMAVDKIKMKITDINNPSSRTRSGQAVFMCNLEIDGIHVAQGSASNKKSAKHDAYTKAKDLLDGGTVTVRETTPGTFQLLQKEPLPVGQNVTASQAEQTKTIKVTNASSANTTTYSTPQIVFHNPAHPLANKPLQFGNPGVRQQHPQSSSTPGELAMKLLNFVKEGVAPAEPPKAQSSKPSVFKSPVGGGPSATNRRTVNHNILKRALDSATAGNLRAKKAKTGPLSLEDLSQFIIIDNSLLYPNLSDISILHASANHNKVVMKFEYELVKEGYMCNAVIGVHMVSSSKGSSKEEAKTAAAKEALNHLREICYTVKVKQEVDNDTEGLTKTALLSTDKQSEKIPDSNIGNMLLRKMGWAGGGVGKDGSGIAEPVKAEMIIGREGLGLKAEQGIGKDFEKNVSKMLTDYIKSDDQRDLHFSSELAKEERAVIHQMGQKMGLKTQSKGKGEGRYLIVSRKRSAGQLLEHIIGCGGSTDKYEVVAPTNPVGDPRRREDISYGHGKQ